MFWVDKDIPSYPRQHVLFVSKGRLYTGNRACPGKKNTISQVKQNKMLRKIVSISLPFFFNILALGAQKNCLFEMAL